MKTAAKLGKAELVKKLIPLCDATDDAALCLAARNGHVECVKLLLRDCNPLQGDLQALFEAALNGAVVAGDDVEAGIEQGGGWQLKPADRACRRDVRV